MIQKFKLPIIVLVYHRKIIWFSAFSVLLSLTVSVYIFAQVTIPHDLEISYLDIGQGDATFIRAPNGNSILIDGGPPSGEVSTKISEIVNVFDKQIDVIIATHADADHIGGLASVLQNYSTSLFLDPHFASATGIYKKLFEIVQEKNIPRLTARKGINILLDDDVVLKILYPNNLFPSYLIEQCELEKKQKRKGRKKCEKNIFLDTNQTSVVARLEYKNKSFLFTGDAPVDVEKFLIDTKTKLTSDILKVGHHGSKTSTSEEFVKEVNPSLAIISVGKENRYGHPHKETLEHLKGIKILRTDELGAITIGSSGQDLILE
jgi:competence protein ComEC